MFKVQHLAASSWVDFVGGDGVAREHERFLDAAAWLAEFIFEGTIEIMNGVRRPEDAYDFTGFRIVDLWRNEPYRMNADHDYVRESDGARFDYLGAPMDAASVLSPDSLPVPSDKTAQR